MLSGCNKKVTIPRRDMTNETCEAGLMCGMSGSHSDEPIVLTSWLVGFTVIVEGQQEIPPPPAQNPVLLPFLMWKLS